MTLTGKRLQIAPIALLLLGFLASSIVALVSSAPETRAAAADPSYSWGSNDNGELGTGTPSATDVAEPVTINTNQDFSMMSSSGASSSGSACAIDTNQDLWCWGYNFDGQLGLGDTTSRSQPTQVTSPSSTKWLDVSVGDYHSCGVTTTNAVYCWGANSAGQLGDNSTTASTSPVRVVTGEQTSSSGFLEDAIGVAAAGGPSRSASTCAVLSTGHVYCWGRNDEGQLGINTRGSGTLSQTPVQVHGVSNSGVLSNAVAISGGYQYACALISDGTTANNTVNCWGFGGDGGLGDGTGLQRDVPVVVLGVGGTGQLTSITQVSLNASSRGTCAVAIDGSAYCWGSNSTGQAGIGTTTFFERSPKQVVKGEQSTSTTYLEDAAQISVGSEFACARTSAGALYCWGSGTNGRLGTGSGTLSSAPKRVLSGEQSSTPGSYLENVTYVSTGRISAYASTSATPASPTPTFDTPVSTIDGFTVNVTNYDANYAWTPTVTAGAVSVGTASGSSLPLTVTGLAAGASDTITVTTTRDGYSNGSGTVSGTAISNALTPTFDTPVATSGGFTVNVTNYDANYAWTPTVTTGSVGAGTPSGSTLPLTVTGLSAGASDTITLTTTRSGYANGTGTVTGTALVARASASPASVSFGVVAVGATSGTQTVTITSSGTSNLVIGSGATNITGADASMFSVDTEDCSNQTLTPSSTCTIEVTFTPTSTGEKSAALTLASNDPRSPLSITLTGGEEPVLTPQTYTFWFDTSTGGPCLDTVQVTDTHIYRLPDASVACVPEGSELVGWSIRGQSWNFAPGAEVVVSGDQRFTAVARAPEVVIMYDSNVDRTTKCTFGRRALVVVPRDGNLAEWTFCTPKGYVLVGWTDQPTTRGSDRAAEDANIYEPGSSMPDAWFTRGPSPVNAIHLYAIWKRSTM